MYTWDGMQKLTNAEITECLEKGTLRGCYLLYGDNTESLIEDYSAESIQKHLDNGGEIGREVDFPPVKPGQRRQFYESGNIFTVGKLIYEDRDFYECTYESTGEVWHHSERIIKRSKLLK